MLKFTDRTRNFITSTTSVVVLDFPNSSIRTTALDNVPRNSSTDSTYVSCPLNAMTSASCFTSSESAKSSSSSSSSPSPSSTSSPPSSPSPSSCLSAPDEVTPAEGSLGMFFPLIKSNSIAGAERSLRNNILNLNDSSNSIFFDINDSTFKSAENGLLSSKEVRRLNACFLTMAVLSRKRSTANSATEFILLIGTERSSRRNSHT